ncbi:MULTISPECIES: Ig-like domain-containing protein [Hydrogenophaga]|uniref:Endoglucanase-like protein n=1 Tax=Hydrogenophaga intermedia TaxID=65786 RepID=A0A1L1PL42_HYDIT|nr:MULTISPECIES: Ig-like domain-containing protein [Hydrogenophaga]AOS78570.1 hypothetical protein Q5W_06115 [Hydrogenophaga sp. PBC]TMU75105.1 hypothetical protein FGJ01_11140 [Hydrogenophaga intermedia]CDN88553.1 Endoglucanase-like protein [Hydrogenophaga intermedia]
MRANNLFSAPSMTPFFLPLLKRPWRWLLLLLIGMPLVWAAGGVSINNLVITTVKQLSFAQAKAEVAVNQQFTQTATARLSPGAVTYRSSDTAVATVNAQTGQVSGVLAGEATITADQAASPPYPAASASYTIKVKGQPVTFQPWQLAPVMYGMPAFQITAPTSNVQGAAIVYSLKDTATTVASITPQGLITVKAVGKTTIVATQKPLGIYDSGTVEAEFEVTAVPGLNNQEIPYTTTPIDLPAQLGGQSVTYTSGTPGVATIVGTSGSPQVSLKGQLGTTELEARNAGGIVVAKATWTVVAGQPTLTVDPVPPLPSTTFETTLRASSNAPGPIVFSIPDPIQNDEIAEINPMTGQLWVKGPGTVNVKVSKAAVGPWAAREITVPVTINDGPPGVQITVSPTSLLKPGNGFDIGYRVNFVRGAVAGHVAASDPAFASPAIPLATHTPPSRVGTDGSMSFRVTDQATTGTYRFVLSTVSGPFAEAISSGWTIPALVREFEVDASGIPKRFNLGAPLSVVYGDKPVMPKSYDDSGAEITDGNRCTHFRSSNTAVLRGVGIATGSEGFDKDHWETAGVGTTVITCYVVAGGGPAVLDYDSVVMTVTGANPRLQSFPDIEIGMDSLPRTLSTPASLNASGTWRYEIVQAPGQPEVARIVNGQIVPVAPTPPGMPATIRATQSAADNFREAFVEATVTVKSAQDRSFAAIHATYGDPDFLIPRPTGVVGNVTFEYGNAQQDVFEIKDGTTIHILNAGTATILAKTSTGETVTGQVIVAKAKPTLLFYLPPRVFGISACDDEIWNWPIKNAGADNSVGGTLITNSDGVVYYPMGYVPGYALRTGPNPGGDYWRRLMLSRVYVESQAPWLPAWVELSETRNFEAARSETMYYGLWASERVRWSTDRQQWLVACDW